MHNIINFLDPKNALELKDWVALCSLLFTMFSFFTAQYLTARSQRTTRQLSVRPYLSMVKSKRSVKLSSKEEGIGKGKLLFTEGLSDLIEANHNKDKVNGTDVDKVHYLKVQNVGPSYALDCKFEVKCHGKNPTDEWVVEGYFPIVKKDEYIYLPLETKENYPMEDTKEMKITFKTQSNETLILKHTTLENQKSKMVLYKRLFWGLYDREIIEFSEMSVKFRNID
ncbi:hypothetical protein [Priestia aryabhattai]